MNRKILVIAAALTLLALNVMMVATPVLAFGLGGGDI